MEFYVLIHLVPGLLQSKHFAIDAVVSSDKATRPALVTSFLLDSTNSYAFILSQFNA
jgi:hypothetical protein